MLAAIQAQRDLIGLRLRADSWSVRSEVARSRDQHVRGGGSSFQDRVLTNGSLEVLDRMEVAILPQQRVAERREQRDVIRAGAEVGRVRERPLDSLAVADRAELATLRVRPPRFFRCG